MDDKKEFLEDHDHHDHNHDDEGVIYLSFEDGEEVACDILGVFEVEEKEYIALLPEDEDEILLYEFVEINEEEFDLLPIEDEEELNLVYQAYVALFEEDFDDFQDEEDFDEE